MAPEEYDVVFVGRGLVTTLLLNELRPTLPGRVAVVEPWPPLERPPVHWSYWSRVPTPYDRFAIGVWRGQERQARHQNLLPRSPCGWCVQPTYSHSWPRPRRIC